MAYSIKTHVNAALQSEKDLLARGYSYAEISSMTGARVGTIKERNRVIYNVNIRDAFRERVNRDGIKSRYNSGDAFAHWFCGYVDGEGCFTVFYRERNGYPERRVGIQISCRYDDSGILTYIKDMLGVGVLWESKQKGSTNPASNWRVESIADLAEVILPIFDNYPLRSKKRDEYAIWRCLVINQYVNTLGGTSTRVDAPESENIAFQEAMQKIREIRHGKTIFINKLS